MRDTPESVRSQYERLLRDLEPSRRVEMACSMFSSAKVLALAGMRSRSEGRGRDERTGLFLHFYGDEFSEDEQGRIALHLQAA